MKKVLFVTNTSSFSGAEKVSLTIIKNLMDKYQFIYILVGHGNMQEILDKNGIKYITIEKLSVKKMKEIISQEQPDLIHANDFRASFVSSFFAKKVAVISHIHQNPNWLKKVCINSFIFLYTIKKVKKVLTVSNSIIDEFIFSKLVYKKLDTVSNPVSYKEISEKVTEIKPIEDRKYDICYVGRLVSVKRVDRLIDIVNVLSKKNPRIQCVIVGDGNLLNILQEKVKKLELEGNITFCGFQANPYQYMNDSKLFCLTSQWEGYGLVAFEAMALGLPVIASDVGGLKEIIDNNCGYLCDSDEEFINEIERLLSNVELLKTKSTKSYEKAKKLDNLDSYLTNISLIYEEEMEK